ncbi:5'-nucleotidase C-terminal domain-containing protein [Allomuricauda sp. SCSIO 65647]|uniref:5'-nucleotidase C-terminal domain-containing protein n=1 Tax=Allomuricauda sp. SCSIO 65647 TaxID=2908843 RepID=UPI001F1A2D3A|nr:5'-nucleotidase [Muricauda sp. SCSIO 65647]UJH67604.1 5'-nucleotidase C-terminal domain-containing protein [Muricauda sp. SCSIO 65647]
MKHFVVFITIVCFASCNENPVTVQRIKGEQIAINESLQAVDSIENTIQPYRNRLTAVMDSVLTFAPNTYTKQDGELNTSAGNLLADLILEQSNKVFKLRTGKEVDFVVLNHGGIRSIISKGNVTVRNAFEVMPFENYIAVVEIQGRAVRNLISFLIESNRAHPIAGLQIKIDNEKKLVGVTIDGEPFDENRKYYVATSDYLVQGGDDMGFFKNADTAIVIDYLVRNAMIDYFGKVDTLNAHVDDRFIQLR